MTTVPLARSSQEDRVATGIPGFDNLIEGGIPRGDLVLLAGHPGSGKTILSSQFLYNGAQIGEPGIYVSFAENRDAFLRNMRRTRMDFEELEAMGRFKFIDFFTVREAAIEDLLTSLLSEITNLKAKRLVVDSYSALALAFSERIDSRIVLHTVLGKMTRQYGVTTLLIAEKPFGSETLGGGTEEFVADGVIALTHHPDKRSLNRRLQVIKMRGTRTTRTQLQYEIAEGGVTVYPEPTIHPVQNVSSTRVPTGIEGLDKMLDGGCYQGSTVLIIGAAGTGKTTAGIQFVSNALKNHKTALYVSLEEPESYLLRMAKGFNWDFQGHIDNGRLTVKSYHANPSSIERFFLDTMTSVKTQKPSCVVLDSISHIERVMGKYQSLSHLESLASFFKSQGITVMLTLKVATPSAMTNTSSTVLGEDLSSLADFIVSLRSVESESVLRRALVIFKATSTNHDPTIREYAITPNGIVVEDKFEGMQQILGGSPVRTTVSQAWGSAFSGKRRQ